jgi:hypothetical protein
MMPSLVAAQRHGVIRTFIEPMPSKEVNDATRKEWRNLGFFYDRDDAKKEWRLVGSRSGLLKFRDLLLRYVANPRNAANSEHDHYGPYMYLKVMTANQPGINRGAIYGAVQDLGRLAAIIETKLKNTRAGSVLRIREEFTPDCEYSLLLDVRDESFDPASADPELIDEAG